MLCGTADRYRVVCRTQCAAAAAVAGAVAYLQQQGGVVVGRRAVGTDWCQLILCCSFGGQCEWVERPLLAWLDNLIYGVVSGWCKHMIDNMTRVVTTCAALILH